MENLEMFYFVKIVIVKQNSCCTRHSGSYPSAHSQDLSNGARRLWWFGPVLSFAPVFYLFHFLKCSMFWPWIILCGVWTAAEGTTAPAKVSDTANGKSQSGEGRRPVGVPLQVLLEHLPGCNNSVFFVLSSLRIRVEPQVMIVNIFLHGDHGESWNVLFHQDCDCKTKFLLHPS